MAHTNNTKNSTKKTIQYYHLYIHKQWVPTKITSRAYKFYVKELVQKVKNKIKRDPTYWKIEPKIPKWMAKEYKSIHIIDRPDFYFYPKKNNNSLKLNNYDYGNNNRQNINLPQEKQDKVYRHRRRLPKSHE